MAKVKDNLLTQGLSGKINKRLVFRHLRNGTTVLCTVPDFSGRVFSEGQLNHQSRFKRASAYAKVAAKTQPIYAELAQRTHQPAYNIGLSDWFHPPVIHEVTRLPGLIRVNATDNVHVVRVVITVLDDHARTGGGCACGWRLVGIPHNNSGKHYSGSLGPGRKLR